MNKTEFIFDGNDACLDFVNTEIVKRGERIDLLGDSKQLIGWLIEGGCIDPGTAERMLRTGDKDGGEILERVRKFRSQLKDMVQAISAGKPLRREHLDPVNEILKGDTAYSSLILIDGRARLVSHSPSTILDPRLHIARAAAELVTNKDLSLVKKCSNLECDLYFYDESKNHGRRWCSMDRCGNRMKAALHYKRKKGGGAGVSA